MNKKLLFLVTIIFSGILLLNLTQCSNPSTSETTNNSETDSLVKEKIHPLTHSWEKAVPHQEIPKGIASLSAEHCGACHQKHYAEWQQSTHAHAWTDLQFQAELKKETSPLMCINCHIPLQNQQEYIVSGLLGGDIYKPVKEKNPHFDPKLQQEGITCASCHVRDGAIIGTIGSDKAPHKVVKDPKFLSETLCISCHNAVAVITPTLACTFETGDEWKAGPFFGKKNCISCHMESTHRELVAGYGERKSHLHTFAGSGIPKFDSVTTNILNGLGIYPSSLNKQYQLSDSLVYQLKVKNEFAGHRVPTGDPERFFRIIFVLQNKNGDTLASQTDRIGEHWEWYPAAKKLTDNNLYPGEDRTFTFRYAPQQKQKLYLSVKVEKHRLDKKSADYNKLGKRYPLFITIFEKKYTTRIQ